MLFRSFLEELSARLGTAGRTIRLIAPENPPVIGAVVMAAFRSGIDAARYYDEIRGSRVRAGIGDV